jgi:hypothetical protein
MGEIFKTCFMDERTTVINHKVFGDCYLVPEKDVKRITNFVLSSYFGFIVSRVQGGIFVPVDISESEEHSTLECINKDSAEQVAMLVLKNFEGVGVEYDYLTILEKITDLMHLIGQGIDLGED